jgi:hypothetical protein
MSLLLQADTASGGKCLHECTLFTVSKVTVHIYESYMQVLLKSEPVNNCSGAIFFFLTDGKKELPSHSVQYMPVVKTQLYGICLEDDHTLEAS